ncbi:MAG: ABC transporter substrate-binding protein, partial [Mailhella sp.]
SLSLSLSLSLGKIKSFAVENGMAMRRFSASAMLFCFSLLLGACSDNLLDPAHPVTLSMCHVYGAQTSSPMNMLVERFNATVGKERGIVVEVTSVSNSTAIHDALVAAAHLRPGAGELPDIFTCYPKTLIAMGSEKALDWNDYFTEEERNAFVPRFLEEGVVNGALRIFPVSKSTNILYVNDTLFQKFSRETGITYADLATWEGMFRASSLYREWSGGKAFFMYDDWLHYAMLNTEALGEKFFKGEDINWESPAFKKVWNALAKAALHGEVCLMPGYSTTSMMMGEAVCGVESSASILYFKDTVTFSDNTTMPMKLAMLPVPLFEGAQPLVIQRGTGLCARKSTPEREYASAVFCKWLASADINLPFAIQCGYLPVRKESFVQMTGGKDLPFQDERYGAQYKTIQDIYSESTFFIPPVFESYGSIEFGFADALRSVFAKYRKKFSQEGGDPDMLSAQMQAETAKLLASLRNR